MQSEGNLLTRDDTFFGVCQGLGEDLGVNPQLLRMALAVALFFNPALVLALYAALGLVLAAARWAFPAAAAPAPVALETAPEFELEAQAEPVPLAA